jgi:endonuclease/exonuclease/phosphatase family metal-dependent hydrolase
VATFNANNQAAARGFLRRRVAPDIVLLQEVKAAHWPTALIPVARLDGRKRESATGIDAPAFSVERLVSGTIGSSAPKGALTAARIDVPAGLDFVAVSVYAQINRGLAYPTAQAIVEDLEPLLHSPAAERLFVGGDFNAWDQFAATAADRRAQQIWQALWGWLEDLGLVNLLQRTRALRTRLDWCACGLGEGCWHVPTVRRMRTGRPAHCDYIFVSRWFAERLLDVDVVDIRAPELADASDHAPVTATFELDP